MRKMLLGLFLACALGTAAPAQTVPTNALDYVVQTVKAVCPVDAVSGPMSTANQPPNTYPSKDGALWALQFGATATSAQQTAAINALAGIDTTQPPTDAQKTYNAAIRAGLTLNWVSTTALSGTYAVDNTAMQLLTTEYNSLNANGVFPSGTAIKPWPDITGAKHLFSPPNFKLFAPALIKYVSQLGEALTNSLAGQVVTWPPSTVSINALAAAEATTTKPKKKKR